MRALTQFRVQAAQNLLVTTDLTAGQIAERIGLTSVHYLSRVFSQHTGESPRVYREGMLEQALE